MPFQSKIWQAYACTAHTFPAFSRPQLQSKLPQQPQVIPPVPRRIHTELHQRRGEGQRSADPFLPKHCRPGASKLVCLCFTRVNSCTPVSWSAPMNSLLFCFVRLMCRSAAYASICAADLSQPDTLATNKRKPPHRDARADLDPELGQCVLQLYQLVETRFGNTGTSAGVCTSEDISPVHTVVQIAAL